MNLISVVLIAKNEAHIIGDTIRSVLSLTDDIIVVDSGSTDGTQDIVRLLHGRLIETGWDGFGNNKNKGIEAARYDWILSIDSDEMPDEGHVVRLDRLAQQLHMGLFRRPAPFPVIASDARGREVLPRVLAAGGLRIDVVDRQGHVSPVAVLAAVCVAAQDVLPGEDDLLVRDVDVNAEADDARKGHRHRDGVEPVCPMRFDQLGLAKVEEDDRLLYVADAHRLVVLIQDQNFTVQFSVRARDVV